MPSSTCARARGDILARCPARIGRPPTTSTRQGAPSASASSMARRLSSSAPRRAARRRGREHAAAAIARHVRARASRTMRAASARGRPPATWSRHGAMARMPCRAQASMICVRVALLAHRRGVDRQPAMIVREIAHQRSTPRSRRARAFMRRVAQLGIAQAGRPASARRNSSARCSSRARALLAADHGEMILMAVEIGHEHDAGLVEARRRLEDMARQRHRRRQDGVEAGRRRRAPARDSAADAAGAMASKMPSSASRIALRRRPRSARHS